jgi:hypothetical protein
MNAPFTLSVQLKVSGSSPVELLEEVSDFALSIDEARLDSSPARADGDSRYL